MMSKSFFENRETDLKSPALARGVPGGHGIPGENPNAGKQAQVPIV
jgi:hypothetical protein